MKILRVRLDTELGEGLDRLRTERHVNLIAWVRSLIRPALAEQLGTARGAVGDSPAACSRVSLTLAGPGTETAPGLILGGALVLGVNTWGSRYQGDTRSSRMIWSDSPSRSQPRRGTPGSLVSSRSWNGPRIPSWSATPGNFHHYVIYRRESN